MSTIFEKMFDKFNLHHYKCTYQKIWHSVPGLENEPGLKLAFPALLTQYLVTMEPK